jgi:hypothetical protein
MTAPARKLPRNYPAALASAGAYPGGAGSAGVWGAGLMLVTQAYRLAWEPTPRQERMLRSHVGAARFAWNSGWVRPGPPGRKDWPHETR